MGLLLVLLQLLDMAQVLVLLALEGPLEQLELSGILSLFLDQLLRKGVHFFLLLEVTSTVVFVQPVDVLAVGGVLELDVVDEFGDLVGVVLDQTLVGAIEGAVARVDVSVLAGSIFDFFLKGPYFRSLEVFSF